MGIEMVIEIKKKKKSRKKALIICAVVLAAIILLFTAATIVVSVNMDKNFGRGDYEPQELSFYYFYPKYESRYPRENVTFKSGENTLQGYIYGAENDKALLVFAHGIGSAHEEYLKTLLWFVDNGYRVFTYDATGSGHSEGAGTKGLPQSALDLHAALGYIENDSELNAMPKFLVGHSWGGYAVTAALNFGHKVDGVASVSGYAEPVEMIYEFATGVVGNARPLLYPSIWIYNKLLFGEYAGLSAVKGINSADTPVLIIHGTADETISYTESAIMNKRGLITNQNVKYLTLDGCNHSGMFDTAEAAAIKKEISQQKREAKTESELIEIYKNADLDTVNQPNAEFLSQIDGFFNEILAKKAA